MEVKDRKRAHNTINTVIMSLLTVILSCPSVLATADFSYINFENNPNKIKLINPLYLDTTRTVKPIIKTITPYDEDFNESEYFTSTTEYDSPVEFVETPEIIETPSDKKNNFFAPPDLIVEDENQDLPLISGTESENDIYAANINTQEEVNLEGKIISHIYFEGLNKISPETIEKHIKTRSGTLFNEELLQEDLQRIYSIGFFTEKMAIEPEINDENSVRLKFVLEENVLVKDISIIGNTVISTMELMPFVTPMKNYPQNIANINNAIEKINNYYHNKGYVLASVDSIDDNDEGNLIFSITEGIIDKILIEGNEKTKDFVISRNILTQPGTVYNENYLKEDLSRIYSTKIFKEVNREVYPSENSEGQYNVKVVVNEDSSDNISIGGGIDSAIGIFGSLSYTQNNFLGRGQKLSATGVLGSGILLSDASIKNRMNYQFELSFFEPYFLNADNSLTSKLYYKDMGSWQVPLAIERRFGINAGVEHKVKGNQYLTTNLSTGFEHISLSEGDFNKISQMYAMRGLDIAERAKELTGGFFFNVAPGFKFNTLDSKEIPRNGMIAEARFIEALGMNDIKSTNGRLAGGITKYFPVGKKSSFSITGRGGVKAHGNDMPEVMAFRLGGPYSVRGFRPSGVGSGDAFLMGSAELATPLPFIDRLKWEFLQKIRLTVFVDAGKVFDPTIASILYDRPMSAITAGVGLKFYIPGVGPISVDYGVPLTNPGSYGSKNGYFTFGTSGVNGYGY